MSAAEEQRKELTQEWYAQRSSVRYPILKTDRAELFFVGWVCCASCSHKPVCCRASKNSLETAWRLDCERLLDTRIDVGVKTVHILYCFLVWVTLL